jgi:hypothetical protein
VGQDVGTDASVLSLREISKSQAVLTTVQTTWNGLLLPGGLYMVAVKIDFRTVGVVQVVEHLPSTYQFTSSNPSTAKIICY